MGSRLNFVLRSTAKKARGLAFKTLHPAKAPFTCPLCEYRGPFMDANDPTGKRESAMCPACSALERHRLQWLVIEKLSQEFDFKKMSLLHFAPEPAMEVRFRKMFGQYLSADLNPVGVDRKADLRNLPFESGSFDMVFASHVLEHIKEDAEALENIRRVLKPGGIALLPVPLIGERTVEYPCPNPSEWDHVRAPGYDYYDRYRSYFDRVDLLSSSQFPPDFQPFVFEDRTKWPTPDYPLRTPSSGSRHEDVVPVCYVN